MAAGLARTYAPSFLSQRHSQSRASGLSTKVEHDLKGRRQNLLGIVATSVSAWTLSKGWGWRSGLAGGLKRLGELCNCPAVSADNSMAVSVVSSAKLCATTIASPASCKTWLVPVRRGLGFRVGTSEKGFRVGTSEKGHALLHHLQQPLKR